jgi:hypothetical protein
MRRHTPGLIVVALVLLALNGLAGAQLSAPSTTSPGMSTNGVTNAPATTGSTSNGMPATTAPTPGTTATSATTIEQIVSLMRMVVAGAPAASVFTVPAGQRLVVTDVLITNPGTASACGASISPGVAATHATTTTPTTASASAIDSGTGLLCVPAQTSLNLGLTTGLEFAAGQRVVLANTATSPLHYHLRGFLVSLGA